MEKVYRKIHPRCWKVNLNYSSELGVYPIQLSLEVRKLQWWIKVQESHVQDCLQLGREFALPWY